MRIRIVSILFWAMFHVHLHPLTTFKFFFSFKGHSKRVKRLELCLGEISLAIDSTCCELGLHVAPRDVDRR